MKWLIGIVGLMAMGGSCVACLALAVSSTGDAKTTPGPAPQTPGSTIEGRWGCFQTRLAPGFNGQLQPKWVAVSVPAFRISGTSYSDSSTRGTVEVANDVVSFNGGALDGWRGKLGADSKPFIAISGENHGTVTESTGDQLSDYRCYLQGD